MTTEQFIEKARKIHGDKYTYEYVEYVNNKTPVKITCPKHGVFEKIPHTFLTKKYGCSLCSKENNPRKLGKDGFIKKAKEIHGDKYDYSLVEYVNNKTPVKIICPIHGEFEVIPKNFIRGGGCPYCKEKKNIKIIPKKYNNNKKHFNELLSFIREINITNYIIKENKVFLPDYKIGFSINDLYSHSEQQIGDKKFHLNELLKYKKEGIRYIQIFEDEWVDKNDIVKNRIKHFLGKYEIKIGARQTKIKEISPKIKNLFLEKTHIQGVDRATVKLGAFYGDDLVGVMTFGKPRVALGRKSSLEGEYELSRFAVAPGFFVMGLGSKMFNYFINNYEAKTIFTFSDRRWNIGTFYINIGMEKIGETQVNYYYVIDGERKHRFGFRKQELPKKLDKFDINLTEYENMLMNGIDRIWDCGSEKFIWHKK